MRCLQLGSQLTLRPNRMMQVNDKGMGVCQPSVLVWMTVRLRPFPTFVIVLVVLIMDMKVFMPDGFMHMH